MVKEEELDAMVRAIKRSLVPGVTFKKWDSYKKHFKWCCAQEGVKVTRELYERAIAYMGEREEKL